MTLLKFKKADPTTKNKVDPAKTRVNWTDVREILSPGLMIAYRDRPAGTKYPTEVVRQHLLSSAEAARTIMRKAVREMDRVVFFRRNEGQPFTNIMNYHFGLTSARSAGYPATNVIDKSFSLRDLSGTDRRWALNKIREGMLSISFHLNTGMYLIDSDNDFRTIRSGTNVGAKTTNAGRDTPAGPFVRGFEEGYLTWASAAGMHKGLLSGWKNGEIHLAFHIMHELGYSPRHTARVIIHEAAHKYLGVTDIPNTGYAHQNGYDAMSFRNCIDNADSYAWAALSLEDGQLIRGVNSRDDAQALAAIPV